MDVRDMLSAEEITFATRLRHIHVSPTSVSDAIIINSCTNTTSNYSTLMSHLSRQHRDVDIESPAVHSIVTSLLDDEDGTRMDLCGFENSSPNGSPGPDRSYPTEDQMYEDCPLAPNLTAQQSLQRSAALFLLTLKER